MPMTAADLERWTATMDAARSAHRGDDPAGALERYAAAQAMAETAGDAERTVRAMFGHASVRGMLGDKDALDTAASAALSLLGPHGHRHLLALAYATAANAAQNRGDDRSATDSLTRAQALVDAATEPSSDLMAAVIQLAEVYLRFDCYAEAERMLLRARDDWQELDGGQASAFAAFWLAAVAFEHAEYVGPVDDRRRRDRHRACRAYALDAVERGRGSGTAMAEHAGLLWAAVADASLGAPRRALNALARAPEVCEFDGALVALVRWRALVALGHWDEAKDALDALEAHPAVAGSRVLGEVVVRERIRWIEHVGERPAESAAWRALYRAERQRREADCERRAQAIAATTALASARLAMSEQEAAVAELQRLAERDELTGLLNRRGLAAAIDAAARGAPIEVGVAIVDVDHFKSINDGYSHAAGDRVLQRIALLLEQATRTGDLAARLGGDELALVIRPAAAVAQVADRLRTAVERASWTELAPGLTVTVSIGTSIGTVAASGDRDLAELLASADTALYTSKRAGRNRTTQA